MFDLRKYWQEVRAIENGLAPTVWLVSIENRAKGQVGGRMAESTAAVASRLLHSKSHRLATDEEVRVHENLREDAEREKFYQRLRQQGIAVVPLQ
jgi:hypothetical protein